MQHLELKEEIMSGGFKAQVGAELLGGPDRGVEPECLGLILGHPFLENLATSQGGKCVGHAPLRWVINTAVAQETGPNIPAPHSYLYQNLFPSQAGSGLSIHS